MVYLLCYLSTLQRGNDTLVVERTVFRDNTPSLFSILLNGKRPEGVVTKSNSDIHVDVRHGQQYIYDTLSLTKEQVFSYFCVGSNTYTPFAAQTDKERVDTINALCGASHIDTVITAYREGGTELTRAERQGRERPVYISKPHQRATRTLECGRVILRRKATS